jgi:DNA polymerase III gamma/tau subunit
VKVDDRALTYIVKAADGSMRDAQSLLDQIISFSGQQVIDADVRDVLGFIPGEILDRTLEALDRRDSRALIENIGQVVDQGLNLQQYLREFLSRVRDMLLVKLGLPERILGSPEEKRALAARAERFSEQDLVRFFDMLLRLENELRWTSQPRFHIEVGFVKLAKIGHVRDIEEVLRDVKQGGAAGAISPPAPPAAAPRTRPTRTEPPPQQPPQTKEETAKVPDSFTFADILHRRVEDKSATTAVYLQKAERISRTENGIDIFMSNGTALAMLQTNDHKSVLDAVATELVGKAVSVSLIMKEQLSHNVATAENAKNEPLVKRFLEVFRGDLAQVKPAEED